MCNCAVNWCDKLCFFAFIYISLESKFNGLQFCRWQYGSIFNHLAVVIFVGFQIYEISRNSKRIWAYSSSSNVIDLGVNRKSICDCLLVINSKFGPFRDIWRLKLENCYFPTSPLFDAPARGGGLEFRDETYPAKTIGMGLYGVNFIIITSTVLYDTSVWQTDGRAIACSRSRSSKHALCCQPVAC